MTSRREFLRLAAGGVMAATLAGACGSDGDRSGAIPTKAGDSSAKAKRPALRIAQWSHPLPAYDQWFDEYVKRWSEEHDVEVIVDRLPYTQLVARAEIEVGSRTGHDLFGFPIGLLAARFEDSVIDHRDIVEEARRKVGPLAPHVERSLRNPKTGRFFAFPDFWVSGVAIYRTDLWSQTGRTPATWDDVLRAAPTLKAAGHPIGIGMSPEFDAHITLSSLLFCYGASIQDEQANVAIRRPAAVEAVKVGAEIFRKGMTPDVFTWDVSSDNRALVSGNASLIVDPVSGLRAAEKQDAALARKIALGRWPAGPAGAFGTQANHTYIVWNFAEQRELAGQFLVDLVTDYREPFLRSEFYNLPAFPGAIKDIAGILAADPAADPKGKYSVLAESASWSTNAGHPGHDNPAVQEVADDFIVPKMFAAAARGEMSAEEAVAAAEAQMKPIFEKWREQGKI